MGSFIDRILQMSSMRSESNKHCRQMSFANARHRASATNISSKVGNNLRFDVWKDIVAVLSKVDENVAEIAGLRS